MVAVAVAVVAVVAVVVVVEFKQYNWKMRKLSSSFSCKTDT